MSFHRKSIGLEVHVPHSFTYADAATRVAAVSTDFTDPDDLFKLARQTSDMTYWVLEQITPSVTWNQLGGGGGAADLPFDAIADPAVDAAVTTAIIDLFSGTVITLTAAGNAQTLQAPTDTTAGRKFFVLNNDTSNNTITVNSVVLSPGQYIEFRWDGDAWLITAGGTAAGAGGFDTQIQYNKAGVLAGDTNFTWDDVNKEQKIIGDLEQVGGEVGNTYTPTIVSTTAIGTNPRNSTVLGSNLYVVDQDLGDLKIFDVTDPAVPVLLGSVTGLGGCRGVDIAGRFVYVSSQAPNTLNIVDVADKSTPVLRSSIELPVAGSQRGVRVRGVTAFTTNNGGAQGFTSVDVTDPDNPKVLQTLVQSTGPRTEFDVSGGHAFLSNANANNNFKIIDVSDPENMSELVSLDIGTTIWAAKVQGPYAYVVGESTPSFQIFDVSDPGATTNVAVGSLALNPTSPRALDVSGNFAYVVDASNNATQVIDIADPTAPVLIGSLTIGQNPVSITTVGRYGYITDNTDNNFSVVDFGGVQAQNLNTGNADIGDLNVRRDVKAAGLISAAAAVFGAEGVSSDGDVVAKGRVLGGKAKNVVEIHKEADFPIVSTDIVLAVGTVYVLMAPISTDKQILHPDTGGAFTPTEIISSNKSLNTLTSTGTGGAFLRRTVGQGQLVLRNLVITNTGSRVFAVVSGLTQTAFLTELDDTSIFGFDDGSTFDTCILNINNSSFLNANGDLVVTDCECNWADMFSANFTDTLLPTVDVRSSSGSVQPSFFSIRDSKLSSQANESFFMLHSNLIAGSTIRINGVDASPFTPGTGAFFDTQTGSITALLDSGGAPGVRTEVVSVGHNVADGDTVVQAGFTTETQMNGTFVTSDITVNSYEIVAVFSGTDTGTFSNASLDASDGRVNAFDNPGQEESRSIGSMFVSNNVDVTVIVTISTFTDLDLGTALAASNISAWTLTNAVTGEMTYQGNEPFSGTVFASISAFGAGGTSEYRFRAVKNGTVLTDAVETVIDVGAAAASANLVVPVSVVNSDTVRLQVENVDNTSDITVTHASVSVQ